MRQQAFETCHGVNVHEVIDSSHVILMLAYRPMTVGYITLKNSWYSTRRLGLFCTN
jgi:hypothetical protein